MHRAPLPLFLLLSTAAWASIGQCPTTPGVASSYLSDGCYAADLNFTNLSLSNSSYGTPTPSFAVNSDVNMAGSFTTSDQPISVSFSAPTTGLACGDGASLFCVNTGGYSYYYNSGGEVGNFYSVGSGYSNVSYAVTVNQAAGLPPPGQIDQITSLTYQTPSFLNTGGNYSSTYQNNGNTYAYGAESAMYLFEYFCLGVNSAAGCTSANQGFFEFLATYGGFSETVAYGPGNVYLGGTNTINFGSSGYTEIYIQNEVNLNWVVSGDVSVDSFSNTFGEGIEPTPEPSTFWMLSAGLSAAALLRRRKKI